MKKTQTKETAKVQNPNMLLGRRNYIMILCSLGIIILGFILLSGGGSENPETEFNYDMFNFRRLYIAPLLLLIGFAFPIYAIMYQPKEKKVKEGDNAVGGSDLTQN